MGGRNPTDGAEATTGVRDRVHRAADGGRTVGGRSDAIRTMHSDNPELNFRFSTGSEALPAITELDCWSGRLDRSSEISEERSVRNSGSYIL